MRSVKDRQHPFNGRLSLFVSGDLPFREELGVRFHLWSCERCRHVAAQLAGIRKGLNRQLGAMPAGIDWQHLSAEMKANIHLGLDVGALVAQPVVEMEKREPSPEPVGWRVGIVAASLGLIAFSGWYLHRIQPLAAPALVVGIEGTVVSGRSEGLEIANRGSALTLLTPLRDVRMEAQAGSGMQARYVDAESGQMTITHVYADTE